MAVRLLLTTSVEEQWRDVAEPWFCGQEAWRDPRPTVVLTPSRAQGFYLRSRLVEEEMSALGVRFWTPTDARKFLLGEKSGEVRSISQAELRLLARMAGERLLRDEKVVDRASLNSVVQDPGPFLRAYDLILGAGWDPARDGADYGRMLAAELGRDLRRLKVTSQAGIHRLLRESPRSAQPSLARVLILGFNAAHWPLWDLLQAVCTASAQTEVVLEDAAMLGRPVDELWIGSWQSFADSDHEYPASTAQEVESSPLAVLAQSYENGVHADASKADIHFIATTDLATQVRAIVLQAVDYLKRSECTRLGIVFPEANALALGVTEQLHALGLPIDDGTGAIQTGLFESRPWQTWIELQEEPTVGPLVHWLRACEASGVSCGMPSLSAARAAGRLASALGQSLIDDLGFLALQLEKESGEENRIVADFLNKRIALPPEGTFADYLASTRKALRQLKWDAFLEELPETPPSWLAGDAPVSRRSYLAWLREVADSRERVRQGGNHFYGKIHLLIYGQMAGQTWSHLILTGMNEGVWPRLFEAGAFGSRYELTELNQKARALNRYGTMQGAQGEGHETVTPGHGHCLLPVERYDLSLRDLCATLQATSHAVCLAAMTLGGGRNLLPSDFFNHAWQAKTGEILEDNAFRNLARIAAGRCRPYVALFPAREAAPQNIDATRVAYEARRDFQKPFGRYEFAYATPPAAPVQLPCKMWQEALSHPSSVWLSRVVGVDPWPEGEIQWPLAIGIWVHRWLSTAARASDPADFPKLLREVPDKDFATMQKRIIAAGIELYPWWKHVWGQARSITLGLGATLGPELAGKKILTEVPLPSDLYVALPGCAVEDFKLQGKIDLLLIEPASTPVDAPQLDLTGCACWIVDFKTGSAKKVGAKSFGEGNGIQIALYGLAVRARGAATTALSLHTFDTPLVPQATIDDLLAETDTFRVLDTMHRCGIFGQSPSGENDYSFQPEQPITTRLISSAILEGKWALVHESEPAALEETP